MRRSVLLVGGAGFLGSQLALAFSTHGWDVAIVDRFEREELKNFASQYVGDLRDTKFMRSVLARHSRNIIYLAHETRTAPAADRLPANFIGNIETFIAFLQEAADCEPETVALFSSGGAVYGEPESLPISESHPTNPISPYGIAKLTMEKYLQMKAVLHGFRHVSLRPSNPYGPGQDFRGAQGLVALGMARIARGEKVTIFGDGSATKDYIYVEDLVDAVQLLMESGTASGCFNVGSGIGISTLSLISMVEAVVGAQAEISHAAPLPGDVSTNVLDITKLKSATGWQPRHAINDGLFQTWNWMRPRL